MEGEGFMDIKKIGFIGTGVMGKSMAGNLFKAGFVVSVYTRTKEKAEDLIMQGIGFNSETFDAVLGFFIIQVNSGDHFFRIEFFDQQNFIRIKSLG